MTLFAFPKEIMDLKKVTPGLFATLSRLFSGAASFLKIGGANDRPPLEQGLIYDGLTK